MGEGLDGLSPADGASPASSSQLLRPVLIAHCIAHFSFLIAVRAQVPSLVRRLRAVPQVGKGEHEGTVACWVQPGCGARACAVVRGALYDGVARPGGRW